MVSLKAQVKRIVPARALEWYRLRRYRLALRREYLRDWQRYAQFATRGEVSSGISGRQLEAQLTKDYHRVEKGLSLRDPKRPFGRDVRTRLSALLPHAQAVPARADYVDHASSALVALETWNGGGERSDEMSWVREVAPRGVEDPDRFFRSRRSVRDFSDRDVDQAIIDRAVDLAINTPSVCNRQSWAIRFFRGGEAREALRYQNGNRGFGDGIPVVAVVTVDARTFGSAGERNQAWIEGGLFSMSFVWALHALGIDACMLNLSVVSSRADALRSAVGLDEWELPIMMIGIGYGREGHRIARSPRRRIDEIRRSP